MAFSSSIDPENKAIQDLVSYCTTNEVTTGKFTIGDEKKHNVFMRLGSDAVRRESAESEPLAPQTDADLTLNVHAGKSGTDDAVQAMSYLREAKNNYRG